MAEALFNKEANQYSELAGTQAESVGLTARGTATEAACQEMDKRGIDIHGRKARVLDPQWFEQPDTIVLTMARDQREAVRRLTEGYETRILTISEYAFPADDPRSREDIPDPMVDGDYQGAADKLEALVKVIVKKLRF